MNTLIFIFNKSTIKNVFVQKHKHLSFLILILFFTQNLLGQKFNYKENAVYVYNFIKYTQWPEGKTTITIGVIGNSPIETEIKNLLSKKGNNYNVKSITITEANSIDVLIISENSTKSLKEIQKLTSKLPILIITEKPDLNYLGACISFYMDEDDHYKTKYQISPFNLRNRKLIVSQQLLNNAELVR